MTTISRCPDGVAHLRQAAPPAEAEQAVACPVCAGATREPPKPQSGRRVTCCGCGLTYADPQPTDGDLAAIYDAEYYAPFGYDPERQSLYRGMKQAWFWRLLSMAE